MKVICSHNDSVKNSSLGVKQQSLANTTEDRKIANLTTCNL